MRRLEHERIAVDLDDVILDFAGGLVSIFNTEYDAGLSIEDITSWNLRPLLDPILDGENWWTLLRERDWLWATFDAIPGAIGGLRTLHKRGHYIEIVTAKPDWARYSVFDWLGKWRPMVDRVTIVRTSPSGGHVDKAEHTDASLLIDDKPQNVSDFLQSGRDAILFQRPHNANEGLVYPQTDLLSQGQFIGRAMNWRHLVEMVK